MSSKNDKKLVTIVSYWNAAEAWIAKNRLADKRIEAFIVDENLVGMNWFYANAVRGIKVQVKPDDANRAIAVLSKIQSQSLPCSPPNVDTSYGVIKCPKCGSKDFVRGTYWRRAIYASILFLGFPIPIRKRFRICLDCGFREKTHPLQFSIKNLLVLTFLVALALGFMRMAGQTWMSNASTPTSQTNRQ
ncbi:MAG: hypothetical protein JXM70_12595 [Pirellulales bacterium]|nr:hypothetical protein [Pirellulales bacterium]